MSSARVDSNTILKAPTCINDKPVVIMASVPATNAGVECIMNILKNPIAAITLPINVGFIFPSLWI